MYEIKAFSCGYCKKIYRYKYSAKRHEKICIYNPILKACTTCGNSQLYDDEERYYYCEKLNKRIEIGVIGTAEIQEFQQDCEHWISREEE